MYLHFNVCVEICPTETFVYRNICVNKCPLSHTLKYFANGDTPLKKYCVQKCPIHAYQMDDSCYDVCPSGLLLDEQQCVKTCPPSRNLVDVNTNRCNAKCPKDLVITYPNKCDKTCPAEKQFIENGSCVQSCPTHSRLYYFISNRHICTNSCAGQYIAFEETNICKTHCPDNRVIIDGVWTMYKPSIDRTYPERKGLSTSVLWRNIFEWNELHLVMSFWFICVQQNMFAGMSAVCPLSCENFWHDSQ